MGKFAGKDEHRPVMHEWIDGEQAAIKAVKPAGCFPKTGSIRIGCAQHTDHIRVAETLCNQAVGQAAMDQCPDDRWRRGFEIGVERINFRAVLKGFRQLGRSDALRRNIPNGRSTPFSFKPPPDFVMPAAHAGSKELRERNFGMPEGPSGAGILSAKYRWIGSKRADDTIPASHSPIVAGSQLQTGSLMS